MTTVPGKGHDRNARLPQPIVDLVRAQANQWLPVLHGCVRSMREVHA